MADFMIPFYAVQLANCGLGIAINLFLVYLAVYYSTKNLGSYKYLIGSFALFEMSFAIVTLLGMPVSVAADESFMMFSKYGLFSHTPWPSLGPAIYCTFDEIWVGFVVVHFIYRYIAVCRQELRARLSSSKSLKGLIVLGCICFIIFCCVCGLFTCTRLMMTQKLSDDIHQRYSIEHPEHTGYILMRLHNENGDLSFAGTVTLANHFVLVSIATAIIMICGICIWRRIRKLEKDIAHLKEHSFQKQLFRTLVIQTLVPTVLCQTPLLFFVSFPLFRSNFNLGEWSLLFSVLISINKWVDPLIVIVCIKSYRQAVVRIITCGSRVSPNTQNTSSIRQTVVSTSPGTGT